MTMNPTILIRETIKIEAEALAHVLATIDDTYQTAVEMILSATGKVVMCGVGKSGLIARKIAATMSSTGTPAIFLHPTDAMHGDLGLVLPTDIVVALSKSGESEELNALLPVLRRIGARLIAITGNRTSTLAKSAEVVLYGGVPREACPFDLAPTASTTAALAIGDALAITLMRMKGFQPQDFALNHPGGLLGRRLALLVADLMLPLERCAVLDSESATMEGVLLALSKHGQGIVLMIDKRSALQGILTDGDIRRLLAKYRQRFFEVLPLEVMIREPIVVSTLIMAVDALDLMERRERPLNVVPVVSPLGNVVGIMRLHELLSVV